VKTADPMAVLAAVVSLRDEANELANAVTADRERTSVIVAWARLWSDLDGIADHLAPSNDEARDLLAGALFVGTPGAQS